MDFQSIRQAAALLNLQSQPSLEAQLESLLTTFNPDFPADTMSRFDMLRAVTGQVAIPGVAEVERFAALIPDSMGKRHVRIVYVGNEVQVCFSITPRKSGAYYEVVFAGNDFSFPFRVSTRAYADMDNLYNHGDDCPARLPEDHPDHDDDCNCTAVVEREGSFTITTEEWVAADSGDGFARLIEHQRGCW